MPDDEQVSPKPEPLSLTAFAESLYHAERADNNFKFLKNVPEQELPTVLQSLLKVIGDAIDDRDTTALARFVQQQQVQAYVASQLPSPVRPDLPPVPLARMGKPLKEASVALFTSGAFYRDDQEPFYPANLSYEQAIRDTRSAMERVASVRMIPGDTPESRLRVGHIAYDVRAAQKDSNVIFPLERFRELAQQGFIGSLAPRNYSYHGLTNIPRLRDETAPQWAQMLKDDGVDAVFLTPG
ncbi:MAG: hypothetical protein H0U76_05050 [Ktedonobacteraceae bacterium]|nr:hypothetical protein [Ktedonobacteraceae bacterium]